MGIVVGILLLSLLMLIHELGHYITGRLLGFKIIEFSLFMGPALFSWKSKKTDIKYSIKLFPIGASVRFLGEDAMGEKESEDANAFPKKEKWKRAVVIGTGPVVNILSAVIALIILFSSVGFVTTTVSEIQDNSQAALTNLSPGDKIISINGQKVSTSIDYSLELNFLPPDSEVEITVVRKDSSEKETFTLSPVEKSSYMLGITIDSQNSEEGWEIIAIDETSNNNNPTLKVNDIILEIEGVEIENSWDHASEQINRSNGDEITLKVQRDNEIIEVTTTPALQKYYNPRGIYFESTKGFVPALGESVNYSVSIVRLTFKSIGKIFTGELLARDSLSGPVGVVSLVGNVVEQELPASEKVANLLWMFALISLNLGIFNLLPIPALDGSHLLLIGIEGIRGKRLSQKVESTIVLIGFLLLISLMVMGLIFDIMRISN